ncbi:MAG: AMP-binding protein, partial [Myxococcota bacterium]
MPARPCWNYGDILERLEAGFPADAPALIHGDRTIRWGELGRRTNNLARALAAAGVAPGDKVALYLRNEPAYTETLAACFKARGVHVNVNFRYRDDELHYILDNSDAAALVYGAEFREHVEALRPRLPGLRVALQVGGEKRPEGVLDYEETVEAGDGAPLGIERSPDDLLFIYTGGTTGMPKGVMWRHEDVWGALGYGANALCNRGETPASPEEHVANAIGFGPGLRQVPCCPLMHGTGLLTAITTLSSGGCLVTLEQPSFEPIELFDTIDRHRVMGLVIVGDAFAKPMLTTLDEHPGRWRLSSLKAILSSGVMWSREVKQGLLRHQPGLMLIDAFGSSEAVGFGTSVTTAEGETRTARFQIGEHCKVFTEDHREVVPGSDEKGFIARCGPIPVGYYKDPEKSAQT